MTALKVAVFVIAGVIATPILALGVFELRKGYWDSEVKRLCAVDGGLTVYEVAEMPRVEYELLRDSFGHYVVRPQQYSGAAPVVRRITKKSINEWNPEVWRLEQSAIRRSDGRTIARHVDYSRVGGDLISFHPSSFSCPGSPALRVEDIVKVKN